MGPIAAALNRITNGPTAPLRPLLRLSSGHARGPDSGATTPAGGGGDELDADRRDGARARRRPAASAWLRGQRATRRAGVGRVRVGPVTGRLALAVIVLATFMVVFEATAGPSALVPRSAKIFPNWEAGPLHDITTRLILDPRTLGQAFTIALLVMFAAYGLVLASLRTFSLRTLVIVVVLVHVIVLLSPPLQLTDTFNYLGYARLGGLHHLNPYTHVINDEFFDPVSSLASWHNLKSPYGELFTMLSYLLAPLPLPVAYWILKFAVIGLSLAFLWLTVICARRLGRDPRYALAFVAFNPVFIIYAIGGFHNDFFMLVPSMASVVFVLAGRDRSAGASLIIAVAVKFTAILLGPFLLIAVVTRPRQRRLIEGGLIALAPLLVLSLIFFGTSIPNLSQQSTLLTNFSIPNLVGLIGGVGGTPPAAQARRRDRRRGPALPLPAPAQPLAVGCRMGDVRADPQPLLGGPLVRHLGAAARRARDVGSAAPLDDRALAVSHLRLRAGHLAVPGRSPHRTARDPRGPGLPRPAEHALRVSAIAETSVAPPARAARRGLDRFDGSVLALFGLLSLWVVGSDLVQTLIQERRWTHTDGFYSGDQLQYLSWIQSSARHGLISNLFVLRHTPADYFQPAIMLSALLVRLGMASWLSLMLWKPVAVLALFFATRAVADHCCDRTFDRRAVLVLGLFFGSLTEFSGQLGVFGDMMSTWQSWGYPFGLIGVALILWAMLGYSRAREAAPARPVWWPGLLGALAATLHPWQGEMMFGCLALAELSRARDTWARLSATAGSSGTGRLRAAGRDPVLRLAAVTLVLVAVPLLYYFALGHLDPVWRMSQAHAKHAFSSVAVLIAAAPLLLFALLGYRGRPDDFVELLLRMWLPATVIIWVFGITALGATPQHAVNGLPLPLAVLAVRGVRRVGLDRIAHARRWALLGIAIATIPGTVYGLEYAHQYTNPANGNADYITQGESDALNYLHADPAPGGVLSTFYLGEGIPGITGRQTFVGDCLWSEPNCDARAGMVSRLLHGQLSRTAARRFVTNTGARFLLVPCQPGLVDPTGQLSGLIVSTRRFGCATLYGLRDSGPARGPLADATTPAPATAD